MSVMDTMPTPARCWWANQYIDDFGDSDREGVAALLLHPNFVC